MIKRVDLWSLALASALVLGGCGQDDGRGPILLPVADDPTITFKVWFKTGSMDDPKGKQGLAWITGQLLAESYKTEHDYETILEKLYPMAASYDVRVDREMTVLSGRTHRDNLERYYALFTDAYLEPAFSAADFDRIKTDTLNYLRNTLRYASDEELGKAALMSSVFDGSSYAHPPQGTEEGVESITLEDVRAFYDRHYAGANAQIALGGGFDQALVSRFRRTLDELPAGEAPSGQAPTPMAYDGRQLVLVSKPDADASISFGFPIDVRRGDREFYALWIANSWLGEHRNSSSHLFQTIREKRGLNYGDYSYIEAFPGGGRRSFPPVHVGRSRQLFEVWIRTLPNENAQFATRAALRELTRLVDSGMTNEQFELTRAFLKKYILHFADTTSARLGYAVDDRFYGIGGAGHLARFRTVLDEITLDEVNAAVRKHLTLDRITFAIVSGQAATLAESIGGEAPSPIEYATAKGPEIVQDDESIVVFPLAIEPAAIRIVELESMFAE